MSGRRAALALLLAGAAGLGGCDARYVVGATGLVISAGPPLGSAPIAVALEDLDGDGARDAAVLNGGTELCTLRGRNDGTLTSPVCVPLAEPAAALAVAALRGEGRVGLLTAGQALTTYVLTPDRTPSSPVRYPLLGTASAVQAAYVKCDGQSAHSGCRQDVLVSDAGASEVALFLANADGSLRGPQHFAVGASPAALLFRDLDGDGAAELVTVDRGGQSLTVLGPRGVATFTGCRSGLSRPLFVDPRALAAIDLDHDGSRVLAVADGADASVRLLRVARSGPFTVDCGESAETRLPVAAEPLAIHSTDLDGDGYEDLVLAHGSPAAVSLLRGGPGGLAAPLLYPVGSALRDLAVGDLDQDGRPDLAVASSGDATVYVLRSAFR